MPALAFARLSRSLSALMLLAAACSHELSGPSPQIDSLDPALVCNAVTTTLTVTGSGLSPLAVDALTGEPKLALPAITLQRIADGDGNTVSDAPLTLCPDTTDTSCTRVRWISQTSMEFDIDPSLGLMPGTYQVTVTNANGHSFTATVELQVVAPPTLTAIIPNSLCPSGGDVVIEGTGFTSGATATIGGEPVTITSTTSTEIMGHFGGGLLPGTYDVVVDNGAGCIDTLEDAVTIVPGPAVYFVDPPVVYNQIAVQSTIYVSGVDAQPATVGIRPAGTNDPLTVLDATWDAAHPNRILATIPSGLAAGDWDVIVDDGNCSASLQPGVTVTDVLTIAIDAIDPPFGWTDEDTAVTITAVDPAPAGFVQFQATPRAYLNPDVTGPTTVASQLAAVTFVDATLLTAIVPDGLPAGLYDLIIVNPDGTVGLLDQAFTVTGTASPPPVITGLTPASVVAQPAQAVTVLGTGFRNPTVQATCEDDNSGTLLVDGVVNGSMSTSIDVVFDMSVISSAVCVVRVTNDDGTFGDFSALAVTNPAQNLPETVADNGMVIARRALSATAGRPTRQARFVYAIGGDDGTDAGLLDSVEMAPVDLFGRLSPWATLPLNLPEGRSFAGAVTVGRFIYLAGGRTATGATDSVLRAQILDPLAAPEVNDLSFDYGAQGLEPGLYYYRVSAVMDPSEPSNPGGETLASDPFTVIVPPVLKNLIVLTLHWSPVQGAVGYRIYRTPMPDQLLGEARLLAEVTGVTQFVDDDTAVPTPKQPLPLGALGLWHQAGTLDVPREGAGIAAAPDPDDPDGVFLYAIGGRDAAGATVATYTFARIAIAPDGAQTVDPFTSGMPFLASGRWQFAALPMDHDRASIVPDGDTWVYAMGGFNAAGTALVRDVTAGHVAADGTFDQTFEVDQMVPGAAGYGVAGANNFLFAFGGSSGGTPGAGSGSAKLCAAGEAGCSGGVPGIPEPPDLVNWNALGFTLEQARYLPGSALESAFIFLVGGASDTAGATTTTERTHW
jgi:hypothetical protein